MGKRIDDLRTLDDTPIEHQVEVLDPPADDDADDLRAQTWYQLSGRIEELLADDRYTWAFDTLSGIKETVERTKRVSPAQTRAVDNIETTGDQRALRWGARGYGSWGARGRWGR